MPAIAPVRAADMQATLTRDLEQVLATGSLAEGRGVGVAIGLVRDGERRVLAFGSAKPDALFEIGSLTKTFTGLMLAQLIEQGRVAAEQPVRELLPPGAVAKPAGAEISLLDLVTQRSGLPRLPANLQPADDANPYVGYGRPQLYAFLAEHGVQKPEAPEFLYSNLGFGLLGEALAERAGSDYAALLRELVTEPLCLGETVVTLSAEQRARLIQGLGRDGRPAPNWDWDAMAGCGALRSTAGDMLKYLEAQLGPEQSCSAPASAASGTLAAALRRSQEPRAEGMPGRQIAFAWFHGPKSGTYFHDGGTGAYSSYALFNPTRRYAVVALVNQAGSQLAARIARHIEQRFAGEPAVEIK